MPLALNARDSGSWAGAFGSWAGVLNVFGVDAGTSGSWAEALNAFSVDEGESVLNAFGVKLGSLLPLGRSLCQFSQ